MLWGMSLGGLGEALPDGFRPVWLSAEFQGAFLLHRSVSEDPASAPDPVGALAKEPSEPGRPVSRFLARSGPWRPSLPSRRLGTYLLIPLHHACQS